MPVNVSNHSRLRFGELRLLEGVEFFDLIAYPEIPVQTDDVRYVVQANDRIDSIATKFYGDSVLWWVIAVANGMDDLPTQLDSGQTIRIPAPRYVLHQLLDRKT